VRSRIVAALALSVLAYSQVHAQVSLSTGKTQVTLKNPVPLATTTIPALGRGDLAGALVYFSYDMVWFNTAAGGLPELRALPGPGSAPAATTVSVNSDGLPAGSYSVRWDFVNVGFAAQLAIRSGNATLTTCSLNALPGYMNVQSCGVTLSVATGHLMVSIQPTTFGAVMTLQQVTVARWQ
jgi:hypothetical protein